MKSCLSIFNIPWLRTVMLVLVVGQTQLLGGPVERAPEASIESREDGGPSLLDVKLDASYSFPGETEFRGRKYGDSDALNFNFSAGTMLPLDERWMMPLELKSQYLALDDMPGVPMPDSISTLEFGIGLAFKPNDRWMYMASFNTTLYSLDDIDSDDIGFSGALMVEWEYSPSWKWMFGVVYQPDNDLPVIPFVGFEWQISEHWKMQLPLSPRITYTPDEQWSFHFGMDMVLGTTFRTSDTLGSSVGLPEFDGELGSYSDFRLGAGVGYQLSKSFSLEVEAGYSVDRKIEYSDIDETVEFDPAPYVRLSLRYEF